MSQMDMGGAILAKLHGRVGRGSRQHEFCRPVAVGDVICCYGDCLSVGRTSIKIKVEVWVKKSPANRLTNAIRITKHAAFVAVDDKGKPRVVRVKITPG